MKKPRILSIDDEPNFTDLIRQYFEPRGYTIDVTCEGKKGLEMINECDYDVVLLDLKMVGIDGEEVMRVIKDKCSNVKIIFITAYNDSGKTKKREEA